MFRAIVFDWARVLCDVSWGYASKELEKTVGFDDKQRMKDAYFPALLQREVGQLDRTDFWTGVVSQYGLEPTHTHIESFAAAYQHVAGEPFPESIALLRELQQRSQYTTAILTNAAPELFDVIDTSLERSLVHHAFYSFAVGARKPNPEVYQHVLQALRVAPEHTLFVDDQLKNVEGARAVGIHAIHFTDPVRSTRSIRDTLALN